MKYKNSKSTETHREVVKIYSTTPDLNFWRSVRVTAPNIAECAFATYHSQLVLVGGEFKTRSARSCEQALGEQYWNKLEVFAASDAH